MLTKAEKTRRYIIEKAAPIFNQKGYGDTSLSDVTTITGLSKGSVYGNFRDKHELAVEAFNYNLRRNIFPLADLINAVESPRQKLEVLTDYYRKYYQKTLEIGGCPILNVGIDTNHQNPVLQQRVIEVINKLIYNVQEIIKQGQMEGEFNKEVNAARYAKRIYSMIEGCIFTAMMQKDALHIKEMMNYIDFMLKRELYN